MTLQTPIINNKKLSRFETEINGEFAYVIYSLVKDGISLLYVFVPVSARGQGISSYVIKAALEYAKEEKLKVRVYCSVIARYIQNHPEYEALMERNQEIP
jgi:predicted GNAT family acetyltransferase